MSRVVGFVLLLLVAIPAAAQPTIDARLLAAREATAQGRFPQAETIYRALIREFPGLAEAHDGLADALIGQSRDDEAFATLLFAGQALVESGEVAAGAAFLERALPLKPESSAVHAALGYALLRGDRYREAIARLEQAIALGETDPMVRLFLGAAQWESGGYDAAEKSYRTLLSSPGPATEAARRSLGGLLVFRGRYTSALPLLAAAVALEPESTHVRYDLAQALEGAGRSSDAIAQLVRIVADSPKFLQAHFRLARLLHAGGARLDAQRHLERFERLQVEQQRATRDLGRIEARINQGWSWLRDQRVQDARRLFSALPETPETLGGLAEACRRDNDPAAALAALRRAVELDPRRVDLRLAIDQLSLDEGSR